MKDRVFESPVIANNTDLKFQGDKAFNKVVAANGEYGMVLAGNFMGHNCVCLGLYFECIFKNIKFYLFFMLN